MNQKDDLRSPYRTGGNNFKRPTHVSSATFATSKFLRLSCPPWPIVLCRFPSLKRWCTQKQPSTLFRVLSTRRGTNCFPKTTAVLRNDWQLSLRTRTQQMNRYTAGMSRFPCHLLRSPPGRTLVRASASVAMDFEPPLTTKFKHDRFWPKAADDTITLHNQVRPKFRQHGVPNTVFVQPTDNTVLATLRATRLDSVATEPLNLLPHDTIVVAKRRRGY
jgi:hypothetical protein